MKRFVIAIVLLIGVAGISFGITYAAEDATEETKNALLSCDGQEENGSPDIIKVRTALNTWEKNRKILYMFMFHDDFSEIEKNMITLCLLTDEPDSEEISRVSRESAMLLENMKDNFRVNLANIL